MPLEIVLTDAIRLLLADRGSGPLDLHSVTALLRQQFPDLPADELRQSVARQAVADGARFLFWEPPQA